MVDFVTDDNFETQVINSSVPVLLDFYADWCGPCKALAPTIESVATKYDGRVNVYKLNVDDSPATAQKFGIMSIPTLVIFKDGEPIQRLQGAQNEQVISSALDAAVAS